VYSIGGTVLEHDEVQSLVTHGQLKLYKDPEENIQNEEVVEYNGFDTNNNQQYESIVHE
jgi:hypothetical protein